ncbi:hypothetical protein BDW66DRAFT_162859 [Aspergillus desertorum]
MKLPLVIPALISAFTLLTPSLSAKTLNIVAHPDDDLLFLNPDIQRDFSSGFTVRTVYLTSGDAGRPYEYWTLRQAGVESIWDESDAGVTEKDIPVYTLWTKPEVSLAFMHIPDGSMDGNGFPATGQESLEKLWKGRLRGSARVDESVTMYSRDELVEALRQIIDSFAPDSGDHSDHTSVGLFTNTAAIASSFQGRVIAYRGYPIKLEPANVGGEDLVRKKEAFNTYAAYDESVCGSDQACAGKEYELWLPRLCTSN